MKRTGVENICIDFRVDANAKIGSGHFLRCHTLALKFKKLFGYQIRVLTSDLDLFYKNLSLSAEFDIIELDSQADTITQKHLQNESQAKALIVDSYQINAEWEEESSRLYNLSLSIDDLEREHATDIVLDQNYYPDGATPYARSSSEKWIGLEYLLLRDEFTELRKQPHTLNLDHPRLLMSFGSTDPFDDSYRCLQMLETLNFCKLKSIHIFLGKMQKSRDEIIAFSKKHSRIIVEDDFNSFARTLSQCDLAIGSGGVTTWERASLGVPSLAIGTASNQLKLLEYAHKGGLIHYAGASQELNTTELKQKFESFLKNKASLENMSSTGKNKIDGKGTERVCNEIALRLSSF